MASIGFAKLAANLGARTGKAAVSDPKALAASIGRKKYGSAGMAKKAMMGKKEAGKMHKKMHG